MIGFSPAMEAHLRTHGVRYEHKAGLLAPVMATINVLVLTICVVSLFNEVPSILFTASYIFLIFIYAISVMSLLSIMMSLRVIRKINGPESRLAYVRILFSYPVHTAFTTKPNKIIYRFIKILALTALFLALDLHFLLFLLLLNLFLGMAIRDQNVDFFEQYVAAVEAGHVA